VISCLPFLGQIEEYERKITEHTAVQWFNLIILLCVMIYPYKQIWKQKILFDETIERLEAFPVE
jgi:hypothetical protein